MGLSVGSRPSELSPARREEITDAIWTAVSKGKLDQRTARSLLDAGEAGLAAAAALPEVQASLQSIARALMGGK